MYAASLNEVCANWEARRHGFVERSSIAAIIGPRRCDQYSRTMR